MCPVGTASLGGSIACTTCADGTYSSLEGSSTCTNCPAGSSCLDVTAEPVVCASGTFSQLGDRVCSDCDLGTYSGEGASSCLVCQEGHSCGDPAIGPVLCPEGFFSSGGVVRRLVLCIIEKLCKCHSFESTVAFASTYCFSGRGKRGLGGTLIPAGVS